MIWHAICHKNVQNFSIKCYGTNEKQKLQYGNEFEKIEKIIKCVLKISDYSHLSNYTNPDRSLVTHLKKRRRMDNPKMKVRVMTTYRQRSENQWFEREIKIKNIIITENTTVTYNSVTIFKIEILKIWRTGTVTGTIKEKDRILEQGIMTIMITGEMAEVEITVEEVTIAEGHLMAVTTHGKDIKSKVKMINYYKKVQYCLAWESKLNWYSAPGSPFEMHEDARARTRFANDVIIVLQENSAWQMNVLDQARTWADNDEEGNRLIAELCTVGIVPYAKHQLVKNLDKMGIQPENVARLNNQTEQWKVQKDELVTTIKYTRVFDAMRFCYVYHNRVSERCKWKCIILLEFLADAVMPQSFIRFREYFVTFPTKDDFVTKMKKAWNDSKLEYCTGRLEASGILRQMDMRMRDPNNEMYKRLNLHPLYEHRLEDIKDSCYQKASRYLTRNKAYAKDDTQKDFITSQIAFHRAKIPYLNSMFQQVKINDDGKPKEYGWSNDRQRTIPRLIPDLMRTMAITSSLDAKMHSLDEDENQELYIRIRNNILCHFAFPERRTNSAGIFNSAENRNEYKDNINLYDLSKPSTTNNGPLENSVQKAITQGAENTSKVKTMEERLNAMEQKFEANQQVLLMGQNQNASALALHQREIQYIRNTNVAIGTCVFSEEARNKVIDHGAFTEATGAHADDDILMACNSLAIERQNVNIMGKAINEDKIIEGCTWEKLQELAKAQKDKTEEQKKEGSVYLKVINNIYKNLDFAIEEVEVVEAEKIKVHHSSNKLRLMRRNKRKYNEDSDDDEELTYVTARNARAILPNRVAQKLVEKGGKYYMLLDRRNRKERIKNSRISFYEPLAKKAKRDVTLVEEVWDKTDDEWENEMNEPVTKMEEAKADEPEMMETGTVESNETELQPEVTNSSIENERAGQGAQTCGEHIEVQLNSSGNLSDSVYSELDEQEISQLIEDLQQETDMTKASFYNMRDKTYFNKDQDAPPTVWPTKTEIEDAQKGTKRSRNKVIACNAHKYKWKFFAIIYSSYTVKYLETFLKKNIDVSNKMKGGVTKECTERIKDIEHTLAGMRSIYEAAKDIRRLIKWAKAPEADLDDIIKHMPIPQITGEILHKMARDYEIQTGAKTPTFGTNTVTNNVLLTKYLKILLWGNVRKTLSKPVQKSIVQFARKKTGTTPKPTRVRKSSGAKGTSTPITKKTALGVKRVLSVEASTPISKSSKLDVVAENDEHMVPGTPIVNNEMQPENAVPSNPGKGYIALSVLIHIILVVTIILVQTCNKFLTYAGIVFVIPIIIYDIIKIWAKRMIRGSIVLIILIMKLYNLKFYPKKRYKQQYYKRKLIPVNKRAKNKLYNLHTVPKSQPAKNLHTPPSHVTANEKPKIKGEPNGKTKMINSYRKRYEKYSVTGNTDKIDTEEIEKVRTSDESLLEMEFATYSNNDSEYSRPSTTGYDGVEREYLINKQSKRTEFDNIRYYELSKRKATLYDPCSAATLPRMFQNEQRMEDIVEDRMRIEGDKYEPTNEKIEKLVTKIKEKQAQKRNKTERGNKIKNTKIAQKLNIISVNLNQPMHQIGKLFVNYKNAHIICVNELREDISIIKNKRVVNKNWDTYTHKPVHVKKKNMVFSAIFVRNNVGIKVKTKYNQAPFTSIYCEIPLASNRYFGLNICSFYKFHPKNDISNALKLYSRDAHMNYFIQHFRNIVNVQYKVPSIITGDINAQIHSCRNSDNKYFINKFNVLTNQYRDLVYKNTNIPNKTAKGKEPNPSQIDIFLTKGLGCDEFVQESGDAMCHNDGHDVLNGKFNVVTEYEKKVKTIQITRYPEREEIYDATEKEFEKIMPELNKEYETLMEKAKSNPCIQKCNCNLDCIKSDTSNRINTYTPRIISLLEKIIKDRTIIESITVDENKPLRVNSNLTRSLRGEINKIHHQISSGTTVLLSNKIYEYYIELKKTYKRLLVSENRRYVAKKFAFEKLNVNDEYRFNKEFNSDRALMRGKTGDHTAQELADYFQKLQKSTASNLGNMTERQHWEEIIEKMDPAKWDLMERGSGKFNSLRHILSEVKEFTTSADSNLCGRTLGAMPAKILEPLLINMMKLDVLLGEYPIRDKHNAMVRINKSSHKDPTAIEANRMLQVPTILASMRGKWISANIAKYADLYGIVPNEQHGFKKKHSCSTAMADILMKYHETPEGYSTYMLMIDFKNAFGTVMHTLIKSRFSKFVKCYFLKYLCGELDNRTAVVREKNMFSDIIKHIAVGLPQGSALGPIGFNCMSGTITEVIKNVSGAQITLFADDCIVLLTQPSLEEAKEATQTIMNNISRWADINGLVLAPDKCSYMVLGKKGNSNIEVEIKGKTHKIPQENNIKYLGFRFDHNLDFKKQINHLKGKLSEIRTAIINVMSVVDREKACNVARALIYGNLNYGAEITPIQNDNTYKEIDRMIVRIIEDIYGMKPKKNNRTSYRRAFHEVGWINYKHLHQLCILRFVNRILLNGKPNNLFDKVQKLFYWKEGNKHFKRVKFNSGEAEAERIYKAGEGQIQTMILKDEDKNCNLQMFPYNAVTIFNELPRHIKETVGTDTFAEMIAEHFKSKCQHRVDKNPKSCTGCKIQQELDEVIEIEYTGLDINFDPVTFAAYRADARTMKDVGNMMINVNRAVNTSIKQEKAWKQLIKVEHGIWEERMNTDALKSNKN